MTYVFLILGAVGHVILWVMLVNRLHAIHMNRTLIDVLTLLCGVAVAGVPLPVAVAIYWGWPDGVGAGSTAWYAAWSYLAASALVAVVAALRRASTLLHPERRGALVANHTTHVKLRDDGPLAAPGFASWLARLPFNEAFDLTVHEEQLVIPRLAGYYEGLRIAHLSDLHMSGRIAKTFFERMVELVNRCEPDLVAITGDIVEREHCLDWIPDTLGRLRAAAGVYYVLGNHDRHADKAGLHAALADSGLIYAGGRWLSVTVRDVPLVVAGNELPWHPPAADLSDCPARNEDGTPLRILLSHSPDQFGWAQKQDVDLMLAGHSHGGQVCLPLVGPILAPCRQGVRYASGAFRAGNTVLHVSRGTSCLTPLRFNCPPEIALLVLRTVE